MTDKPEIDEDRRSFLARATKASVVMPPAMTYLLSTTLASEAVAMSCNRGLGNGPEGCDPGNSGGMPGNAGEGNE